MFDKNTLAQLHANYLATRPAPQPKAQPKKKGNFFTDLIPSVGGIGGAAGGAAIGTALLPGIGTIAGGLIGGAIGSGGGKVAENAVEGNKLTSGVASEAALNGVLGAGPLRLGKVAFDTARGLKAGAGLTDAVVNAGTKATSNAGIINKARTAIANKGSQLEARAGGFGIGEKVPGSNPLGFYDSAQVSKNLKAEGIKAGSPEARLKQVEDAINTRGKQIDIHLTANNSALSAADKQAIAQKFLSSIEQQPGVDELTRKKAAELASNFTKQSSDLKSLVKFRRGLDQQVINFNQNPSSAMVAKQLAARTFRDVLSESTSKAAPGIKSLNKSYSNLVQAKEFLTGGAKAISDQSQSAGGGLVGRTLTSDTAQAAKSKIGVTLQKAAPNGAPNPFSVESISKRIAPVGLTNALLGQIPQPVNAPQPAQNSQDMLQASPQQDNVAQLSDPNSPFAPQNVEASVKHIIANGGTLKDATDFLSLADAITKMQTPPSAKLNATQLQQANNANSGLSDLQTLSQMIQSDPSILFKDAIPGGGLARRVTGTQTYDAAKRNIVDVISRLRSGAAITPSEAATYMSLLPGASDTPQTAADKLSRLTSLLSSFASPQSAQPDLTTALLSAQG